MTKANAIDNNVVGGNGNQGSITKTINATGMASQAVGGYNYTVSQMVYMIEVTKDVETYVMSCSTSSTATSLVTTSRLPSNLGEQYFYAIRLGTD